MNFAGRFTLILPPIGYFLGYFGAIHPFFDSISVFAVPLFWVSIACIILLILMRSKWVFAVCAMLALSLLRMASEPAEASSKHAFGLYQKNLLFSLADPKPMIKDIKASSTDFVTLQEVTQRQQIVVSALKADYPSQQLCRFATVGGVAVMSKFPMVAGSGGCIGDIGAAYIQVETDKGPVWVISVHHLWPWPHNQARQAKRILAKLETLKGPKIVAGDFNIVPWSHQMRTYEKRLGLDLAPHQNTFHLNHMLWIPIDHVLTPPSGNKAVVTTRPFLGSDHLGLLARFDLN